MVEELLQERRVVEAEARVACLQEEVDRSKQEVGAAVEETHQAQGMVEELLQEKAKLQEGGGADKQLLDVVQQLQSQLEGQRGLLLKYEPKLKKKEKEAKELTKEVKQMKADVANANLEADKLRKQLEEVSRAGEQNETTVEELKRQQEEWKSLSDLLQSQLDAKNEEVAGFEEKLVSIGEELSSTKSRMLLFKNEAESKEEQLEILQETLEELQQRKSNKKSENGDENGWDDDGTDGWEVEDVVKDVAEAKEVATLRIESKKAAEARDALQEQVTKIQARLEEVESEASAAKEEAATLREVRDEVVKDRGDVQRRLDVLTEFFNKKEAEMQKQLGLQSAKFGDVSTDAESTARKLISVTSELDSTSAQVRLLRTELEDQEKSLKASVAAQEKKAHENWVAARQAERKLTEVQSEMSVLRNRLTVAESRNTLLEQEKGDLSEAVTLLQQNAISEHQGQGETRSTSNTPSESGLQASSPGPSSLPPLPGLPSLPGMLPPTMPTMPMPGLPLSMPPIMPPMSSMTAPMFPTMPGMMSLDSRPPPIGRMSPPTDSGRNRSFAASRSPSPDSYDRGYRRSSYRDSSPTSRSERRLSPRRPSPTRSDRGYRDRREYPDYRDRDNRYYSSNGRDTSPDRYSDRSHRSDKGSSSRYSPREERDRPAAAGGRADHLKTNTPGPKTSSPMEPLQGSRNYGAHV